MNAGYVKVYRSLLSHPLWTKEKFTPGQAWIDLLLEAGYADRDFLLGTTVVSARRGEIVTSQVKLAKRWLWDRKTVLRFLRGLERLNMVRIQSSRASETGYTLISIVNWETYQSDGKPTLTPHSPSDAPSDSPSDPHPIPTVNKGKKGIKSSGGVPPPLPVAIEQARKDLQVLRLSPWTLHRYVVTYIGKLDLAHELRRAESWCQDNPNRAPRKNHAAFVTRWLNRACNGASASPPPAPSSPIPTDAHYHEDGCHKSQESAALLGQPFRQCATCRSLGELR